MRKPKNWVWDLVIYYFSQVWGVPETTVNCFGAGGRPRSKTSKTSNRSSNTSNRSSTKDHRRHRRHQRRLSRVPAGLMRAITSQHWGGLWGSFCQFSKFVCYFCCSKPEPYNRFLGNSPVDSDPQTLINVTSTSISTSFQQEINKQTKNTDKRKHLLGQRRSNGVPKAVTTKRPRRRRRRRGMRRRRRTRLMRTPHGPSRRR